MNDYENKINKIKEIVNEGERASRPDVNEYGFTKNKSAFLGVQFPYYNDFLDSKLNSADTIWRKVARESARDVIVNYDLSKSQTFGLFWYNEQKWFNATTLRVKAYSNDYPLAAQLIQPAYSPNGRRIKGHVVACARNASYKEHKQYKMYLRSIQESLIRYTVGRHKLLSSSAAVKQR